MISAATFAYLRGLAANNEKPWFEANRDRYERDVKAAAAGLAVAVDAELKRLDLPLEGDAKRSTFRIHRDVRFSKDKRPFKTQIGIVWFRPGHSKSSPGVLYAHVEPGGCFAAAAFYIPDPEVLDSIRERIRVHPDRFAETVAALAEEGLRIDEGNALTRLPRGFEDLKGTAVEPALRLKSFIVRERLTERQMTGRTLPATIAGFARRALPLLRFGWAAIDEAGALNPTLRSATPS